MKDFVSSRPAIIVAAVGSLLVLWAIVVVPGGPAWNGFVSLSVLAVLLAATAKLVRGAASPAAMSEVIRGVEGESKASHAARVTAPRSEAR